jgi:hypothetical protein
MTPRALNVHNPFRARPGRAVPRRTGALGFPPFNGQKNPARGDLFSTLDALDYFLANLIRRGWRSQRVEDGRRQIPNGCGFVSKLVGDVHEVSRGSLRHPKLGLDPVQKMAVAETSLRVDQVPADLDDVESRKGDLRADAPGDEARRRS